MEEISQAKPKQKKRASNSWLIITGMFLLVVAVVLIIWFLLQGKTKTTGNSTNEYTSESLSCIAINKSYDFYESNSVLNSTTQINAIFNNDKIGSISLLRKATHADDEAAKTYADGLMGNLNISFGSDGLAAFSLSANYGSNGNTSQISLYANSGEVTDVTIKYFMLDTLPTTIDDYQEAYQNQGFDCEATK